MTKTHTMRSRLISLVLVLVMVLGCLPMSALAWDANGQRITINDFELNSNQNVTAVLGQTYEVPFKLTMTIDASKYQNPSQYLSQLKLSFSGDSNCTVENGSETTAANLLIENNQISSIIEAGAFTIAETSTTGTASETITISGNLKLKPSTINSSNINIKVNALLYTSNDLTEWDTHTASITFSEVDDDVSVSYTASGTGTVDSVKINGNAPTTTVSANEQVKVEVTLGTDTELTGIYGSYTNAAGKVVTFDLTARGGAYYFNVPAAEEFATAKAIELHLTTKSTAKTATTVELALSEKTSVTAGDTLTATATVKANNAAITDAAGSIVAFTWPDDSVTTGYVSPNGVATASWAVTDDYANSLTKDNRNVKVKATYWGNEVYAQSAEAVETVEVRSRTIKAGPGAAINATLDGGNAIQSGLTVLQEYKLSLTGNAVVSAQSGVDLTENTHYTVTWYENTGSGVWNKIDALTVTPQNINTQYKAVVKPAGSFTLGEFELVIGCAELADSAVTVNTDKATLTEGETLLVKATVTSNGGNASGGVVVFVNDVGTQLGSANVINGFAKIELTNLAAGEHKIGAHYLGAEGVYAASQSAAVTVTVKSAELPADGWSIKVGDTANGTLTVAAENTLSIDEPAGYTTDDYRVEWLVSKDGGETWALVDTTDTIKVTPANRLYQYRAIVYPDGKYTKPAGGISVTPVNCGTDAGNYLDTEIALTAIPGKEVFENEGFTIRAQVTSNDKPVTSGLVTFAYGSETYVSAIDAGGFAEFSVPNGVTVETTYKAAYKDNSEIYADSDAEITITVKSREIALYTQDIIVDGTISVGSTVTLTAPKVIAKGTTGGALTVGRDFYYQWQFSTDYNANPETATWLNFSAPAVGTEGRAIRVTIGDANTAFRVVAMPYGNYMYPATGVATAAVCGNSDKVETTIDSLVVRSVSHGGNVYEGDDVQIMATVKAGNDPVTEGIVVFSVKTALGNSRTIGTAAVNAKGEAVLDYTAYKDQMASVSAQYYGNAKYADSAVKTETMKIKSVEIAVQTIISTANTLTVGSKATVNLPVVVIKGSTTTLTIGKDYYIQWLVDNGSGWSDAGKQYTAGDYTFTPANENSKLAAVVFPMGNYLEPAEGVSAGVLSNVKTIETTTTLTVDSTDYEGSTAIVTAKVETKDGKAVLDGLVEFYVQYGVEGSGDYTKYTFATSRLNKNGEAAVTFEVPIYSIGTYQFYAHYVGTEVYGASSSDWSTKTAIKSATIAFGTNPAIAISNAGGTVAANAVQVGETYTLTAPEVYEKGTSKELICGTDYYYIWQYSADGSTWETVQSDVTAAGNVLNNAVFGNKNAEYRAIAYPMGGSGSIYRYPANGIVVATSLDPTLRTTETALEVSNYYAKTGTTPIFPVGRNITLTATVKDATDKDPAYGVVTFSYTVNSGADVVLGSVNLDPGGVATITVPAPATVNNNYSFKATYAGNEVYSTSNETAQVAVMPNEIELTGTLTIYAAGTTDKVNAPVVGTAYDLSGVTANFVKASRYPAIATAVNDEHAKGVNPYYTYVWQKSEDGGVTWYNLDNAGDSNVLKDVVFETDQTQYRLAAYPVASSGWIAPAAGVYSDPVSVETQDTEVTITMKDEAGVAISNKANRFENTEVNVTVNVSGVADYVEGSKGYVQLEVVRYHTDSKRETVYTTTGEVDNSGNVTFKVTLPAYSYNPTTGSSNQVNFVATYSGDDHFTGSELNVGQAFVNLQSAAITWPQDAENPDAFVKDITIYEGTDTSEDGTTTDTMVANETYTLKLPTIYSGDVFSSSGNRKDVALTVNEDYTVVWQYRPMGETTNEWRTLDAASADTCVVICKEGQEDYSYRAVITPMGDYTFAMDDTFGKLTATKTLTTNPTADTVLADTTTDLTITGTVAEANNVKIYNDTPFATLTGEEHYTQYEGETVTLKAKVVDADGNLVPSGHVYFYRVEETENSQTHVRLNTEYVEVKNGFAEYTVNIRDYDEDLATIANVDKFYAVYEANDTYNTSASTETTTTATGLVNYEVPTDVADMVYIRSTAIATPRLTSTENGSRDGDDNKKTTTWTSDLAELPAAVKISFSLMRTAGNETEGYSVVGTDGRWLTNGTDYTIQWYREDKTVEDGGEETGSLKAIDGATQVTYTKAAAENFQKYCVEVIAAGHMKTGAMSKQAIIGKTADPVLDLNPGYTFTEADATFASGVDTTSGAHYGDEVTLTATVQGDETTNALPTGTVTFYYRVERSDGGYTWTQLTDPIDLQQKDVSENKLVAVATYTFNSSELPFNVDRIGFSYSGDDYYSAYSAASMQTAVTGAEYGKMEFKLWSVQISNPLYEGVDVTDTNYTDAACYPDGKDYGNVTINIYEFSENADGYKGNLVGATADAEYPDIVANTKYTLEVQDIYTKNGEKLELAHDNSADYTIEWFKSTDGGLTWGPLPETEYTNIDAKTIAVTPLTKDYKYMVKVTTTNSFYNEEMPSLVDFEYSEKNVNTILQTASVDVQAVAETPVNSVDEWVYQSNPITLFATVTPTNNGEPSGHVEFYYGFAKEGSAEGDYSEVKWTPVKSDTESGTNVAELVKTTSGTDTDGVMVAQLTTSNLPVTTDGTYSQLVIKAVYTGDQTYAKQDNINGTVSISSDVVTVFSSKIRQDVENISNKVLTFSGNDWTSTTGATGDLYDGVIITAKQLVSDGTKTVITLNPVYTLDVIDREDAIFTDLSSIYTLTAGVDYTVEWQYCENYTAYKEYLDDPATNDKNWMIVDNASVSSDFCTVEQVQGYAYRAVITPCDTEKAQKSFLDNDEIYTNILVVGDAEARVLTNIRKASSASVKGDTVYIDAIIMGGTTTPVGNVTVTVTEKGATEPVFTDNRDLVNGWTTFTWKNVKAGEYTIKTVLTGNNGYVGETEQDYIVRFTAAPEGDLTMSVTNKTVTYDGQVKMLSGNDVTIDGFGTYTEWADMAKSYVTFQYFDEDGNRVAEPVDAGTYTVKAYLPESMYWGYVTATGTLTIEKRTVSIADVTAQAKTYDGTTNVYVQNVELELSELDASGLPINDKGLVEGDSVYVDAKATAAANAGEQLLTVTEATLKGPDASNYVIANPKYSENFVVSRNQLYGDAVTSITAAPGYQITDEDFYMIDQAGNQITAADATITYYYHTGNDILKVTNTNGEGKYTVVISMPESNYKGGLTTTLYIKEGATTSREDLPLDMSATSALAYITNTNHVYDGTPKSVTVTTTNDASYTVSYAGDDGTYSTDKPVDAGRYMVKVETADQTYYGVMTIVKGEPQFSFSATSVSYDGDRYDVADLELSEDTTYDVLDVSVSKYGELYYTYVGGSIVGYDYNAPRDVSYNVDDYVDSVTSGGYGAYMVTAHVPETANTIAVTPSAAFEIKKIELKIVGDDIYTRLFDTHSKLTSTYEGFKGDDYGNDSELRDLIALPTYKLGDHELLSNEDMSQVGYLTIHQSDVNARNYYLTYVDGEAAINKAPTQDQLEIRNDPSTIYYGDNFQLFLYGSSVRDGDNVVQVNEASAVYWESKNEDVATVDENGNVKIVGVGEFTIIATRGDDPDTAISTSETYKALPRRNDVVIARDDYLYDGKEKEIADGNFSFYYMYHGTRFESKDPLSVAHCDVDGQPQTDSGEYPVTATITGASKNCGDGAGMLAIHRVNSTVMPDGETAVYGNGFPGGGYDADPIVSTDDLDDVLANGLVAADVRTNSDVDHYEILVAGGTEGWNYNVTYAPYAYSESNTNDFDVIQKDLTFTVGSLADTEGMTENWRKKTGTLAGTFEELPDADFMRNDIRTFGELNQVLDYRIGNERVSGDSIADLWDTNRANANFAELNNKYPFSVEGAANRTYTDESPITQEHGTLDHQLISPDPVINEADYVITGNTNSRNYNVKYVNGDLNVKQRLVGVAENTVVVLPAKTDPDDIIDIIGPQITFNGLADKLDHDYRDLLLSIAGTVDTEPGTAQKTYTLVCGNTNYYMDPDNCTITIIIGEVSGVGSFFNKTPTQTYLRLQRVIDSGDGTTMVQPATGITNLMLTITSTSAGSSGQVLVKDYMTEIKPGDALWDDSWDADAYAYYALVPHDSLLGYRVKYDLSAPGYSFNCT